tara:strand:- start:8963 stop:9637 length:675 start_codon:yes stop_codon:yes gene_type:complete
MINMNSYDYYGYEPDVAAANQVQANLIKQEEQKQAEVNAVIQNTSNQKLAQLMNTPTGYDAIWETIPEQYQKLVTHPNTGGVIKGHSAQYDPYSVGVKVSGEGTVSSTPPPTPSTNKDGDQMLGTGTNNMPYNSIYIWIDNGWHYQGQAGDPTLISKDQFVKNYYQKQAEVNEIANQMGNNVTTTPSINTSNWNNWLSGLSSSGNVSSSLNRIANQLPFSQWFS